MAETVQSQWASFPGKTFQSRKHIDIKHSKVDFHNLNFSFLWKRASCAYCHDRIWGLGRQGFKCIQCKLLIHKKCHKLIKISCNTEQVAALNTPSQVHLLSNSALNTSSGSVVAAAAIPAISSIVNAGEPPIALRQNGDGTEAPSAPPIVQPIFESHSVSVPVDGSPGTWNITHKTFQLINCPLKY